MDKKFHLCAFFSHPLSPVEENYDIGNRELLAVKLPLEEWRQWLEGAQVPFLVWIDHKNLEFLKMAKRRNSQQARWALFFSRFEFILTYRPRSKNTKPDALSRRFEAPTKDCSPDSTVQPQIIINAIEMDIERKVRRAQADSATPSNCPDR